jgi:hypothetical protein
VYAALSSFGAPLEGITVEDLASAAKFIRFGREPVAIGILPFIDGVDFDNAWTRRVTGVIDIGSGLTAFFISKADLISSKIAAGRLRDLADVEDIRDSEASQRAQSKGKPAEQKDNDPTQ